MSNRPTPKGRGSTRKGSWRFFLEYVCPLAWRACQASSFHHDDENETVRAVTVQRRKCRLWLWGDRKWHKNRGPYTQEAALTNTDAGQGRAMVRRITKTQTAGRGLQPGEAWQRLLVVSAMETRLSPTQGFTRVSRIIKWPLQTDLCAFGLSCSYFGDLHLFTCGSLILNLNITRMHFYLVSTLLNPWTFLSCSVKGKWCVRACGWYWPWLTEDLLLQAFEFFPLMISFLLLKDFYAIPSIKLCKVDIQIKLLLLINHEEIYCKAILW